MNRLFILAAALAAFAFSPSTTFANQIVYNVDLGSTAYSDFALTPVQHFLRVAGTVTYDTDLHTLVTSSLAFFHENDDPVPLPPLPELPNGEGQYYHWSTSPTELRLMADVPRYDMPTSFLFWAVHPGPTIEDLFGMYGFYTPQHPLLYLQYSNYTRFYQPGSPESERVGLGILDRGFLFGTAVPEPSTLALAALGTLGLLTAARRKR